MEKRYLPPKLQVNVVNRLVYYHLQIVHATCKIMPNTYILVPDAFPFILILLINLFLSPRKPKDSNHGLTHRVFI